MTNQISRKQNIIDNSLQVLTDIHSLLETDGGLTVSQVISERSDQELRLVSGFIYNLIRGNISVEKEDFDQFKRINQKYIEKLIKRNLSAKRRRSVLSSMKPSAYKTFFTIFMKFYKNEIRN